MKIYPGIHRNLDLDRVGPTEGKLIKSFSKTWRITFFKAASFKEGRYTFAFGKPTTEVTERYHIEREVMILFSSYQNFDTRTFDFVDKTLNEYQNRLDKLLIILVSMDKKIEEKVTRVVMEDQEARIIIPFHYDDFQNGDEHKLINEKLRKYFFTRDLFSFNSPLKSENYFFGRTKSIKNFYDKYRTGENSGLFGLRKIGKTSALYAIRRLLDIRGEPSVFIDCQDPGFHMRRWNQALEYIIKEGVKQLNLSNKKNLNVDKGYDELNASSHFEEDLKTIYKESSSNRILIILDEIESITFEISPSEHWTKENDFIFFWQAVRSTYQKNPSLFSIIIAGVNPKCIETGQVNGFDNPIYKMIRTEYLNFFNVSQVQEMVSTIGKYMGLTFDNEIYTYLTDDYGGHPFLIRDICSYLTKKAPPERPFNISKHMYIEHKNALDLRLHDYLRLILDVLKTWYSIEYELLAYLAAGDLETFKEFAIELSESIRHLIGYGIVVENKNEYHFRIKSIQEYILKTVMLEKKLIETKEDRQDIISKKRNKLEADLRKIIQMVLISRYGQTDSKKRVLEKLDAKRSKKMSELTLKDILESEQGIVYFRELQLIITSYWSYHEHFFGRDREAFVFYMNHINKYRIDAHSKDISDEDFQIITSAFTWFDKKLEEVSGLL
jgi:hypothetical protein